MQDIRDHGATPGEAVNTRVIQTAIDAAAPTGGRVNVPPGVWRTGTVWLRSGVELHVQRGAVLLGTNDPADYPFRSAVDEGLVQSRRCGPRRMIGAFGCEDVAVTGLGVIDGDGGCGVRADRVLRSVPEHSDYYPEVNMFTKGTDQQLPSYGLYARHVAGLTLRDVRFRLLDADAREALVFDDVTDLDQS